MVSTRFDYGITAQVFTTKRVDAVVADTPWYPQPGDVIISAPVTFAGVIWETAAGEQAEIPLFANNPRGLDGVVSATFDADGLIEVM